MEPSRGPEFIDYEEVLVTYNPGDRAILKSLLESESIEYILQGEHAATYVFQAIPVRLLVRKDQVEKARDILQDFAPKMTYGGMTPTDGSGDEQDPEDM